MTRTFSTSTGHRPTSPRFAAALALAIALNITWGSAASAQGCEGTPTPPVVPSQATSDLEKAYWACDHATTHQAFDRATAMTCSVIYEELKAKKFNGDFCRMLAWWRQQRDVRQQALNTSERQRSQLPLASKR